jgi:hypothetical protein
MGIADRQFGRRTVFHMIDTQQLKKTRRRFPAIEHGQATVVGAEPAFVHRDAEATVLAAAQGVQLNPRLSKAPRRRHGEFKPGRISSFEFHLSPPCYGVPLTLAMNQGEQRETLRIIGIRRDWREPAIPGSSTGKTRIYQQLAPSPTVSTQNSTRRTTR